MKQVCQLLKSWQTLFEHQTKLNHVPFEKRVSEYAHESVWRSLPIVIGIAGMTLLFEIRSPLSANAEGQTLGTWQPI